MEWKFTAADGKCSNTLKGGTTPFQAFFLSPFVIMRCMFYGFLHDYVIFLFSFSLTGPNLTLSVSFEFLSSNILKQKQYFPTKN